MNTMTRFALIMILPCFAVPCFAQRVVAHAKQVNLLDKAEALVNITDPELKTEIESVRYPFEFAPEPEPVKDPVTKQPVKVDKTYTDQEILEAIAPMIRPTGSVVGRDGRGVLILPQGQLPDGSNVKLNFRGNPYMIKVIDVNSESYKLELNDSSIIRIFDDTSRKGVTRDQ